MSPQTIKVLNQVNTRFYQNIAQDFNRTRKKGWEGWEKLQEPVNKLTQEEDLTVLDLACGNARFAHFLLDHNLPISSYTGIDNNQELLDYGKESLVEKIEDYLLVKSDISSVILNLLSPEHVEGFQDPVGKLDRNLLLKALLENKIFTDSDGIPDQVRNDTTKLVSKEFNLITVFGFLHHIPSYQNRLEFIKSVSKLLNKTGLIALSLWQYHQDPRFQKKLITDPAVLKSSLELTEQEYQELQADLEPNDYFITWNNNPEYLRYVHCFSDQEIKQLVNNLDLELVASYKADGKSNNLNHYLVFKTHPNSQNQ